MLIEVLLNMMSNISIHIGLFGLSLCLKVLYICTITCAFEKSYGILLNCVFEFRGSSQDRALSVG